MAASQTFVGAVDKNELATNQRFRTGIRQGIEEHGRITGRSMRIDGCRAVKEFIAIHLTPFIQDGLAPNHGNRCVRDSIGQAGSGVNGFIDRIHVGDRGAVCRCVNVTR